MTRNILFSGIILMAMVRARADDPNADDLRKMQGDWMVASMAVNGMKLPDDEAQALFRTIEGEAYAISRYSKVIGKGSFRIDATKSPRTIDSMPVGSGSPDKQILGIYEFDGERLRICNAALGKPRPSSFESKPASDRTLIVWEREKK